MSELPSGWIATTLGQVVNYAENEKIEPVDMAPNAWLLELEDIERDSSKLLDKKTVAERAPKSSKNKFRAGDVLYGKLRPYLNKVLRANEDGFCSSEIIPISAGLLNRDFIFHALRSPVFIDYVQNASHGMGMPRLGTQQAKAAPFLLPPLAEQIRIAQKLDELLAQVDTLKARLDATPTLLKRFRQSVLAAAVSGRLTEEWRTVNAPEIASTLDEGWRTIPVDQISADEKYSLAIGPFGSNLKVSDYREEGRPLVFVREIRAERFGDQKTKFITPEKFAELNAHQISAGDILITKMGDPPGDVAIYPENAPDAVVTADCIKFRVNESIILRKFAYFQMRSELFRQKIKKISAGVAQQKVSLGNFREVALLVPPLAEQTEIVRRVEQLFAFADQLEAKVASAKSRIDHLTQSILAKAFRGELVAHDPNDEPASELLERIKAQRAAAPKAKRGRKASA
ncbi:MAG: restriction endonuclease subunit S [Pseudomonas sp.]|nr:restriction endonuclease subunit S [Pseudomonas sp.]